MNILLTSRSLQLKRSHVLNNMEEGNWSPDGIVRSHWPHEFTLAAFSILKPREMWRKPLATPVEKKGAKIKKEILDDLGLFQRGCEQISPERTEQLALQIHAECLLEEQEMIPETCRNFELIFAGTAWRDDSLYQSGNKMGYMCHPCLKWHWYSNTWALEWYWLADGVSRKHLVVEIPSRPQ